MLYEANTLLVPPLQVEVVAHTEWESWTLMCLSGSFQGTCYIFFLKFKEKKITYLKKIRWRTNKDVRVLCFSPCARWLLAAGSTFICIIPCSFAFKLDMIEDRPMCPWMSNEITNINSKLKSTTCGQWWRSFRKEDYGVLGSKKQSLSIVDLSTGELRLTISIPAELSKLELIMTSDTSATRCLLTSCSGAQWLLWLEKRHVARLRSVSEDPSGLGFESLDVDMISPVDIVVEGASVLTNLMTERDSLPEAGVSGNGSRRSNFRRNTLPSNKTSIGTCVVRNELVVDFALLDCSTILPVSTRLRMHHFSSEKDVARTFISLYDSVSGVLQLIDVASDPQSPPLFTYGLPQKVIDVHVTEQFLVCVHPTTVTNADGQKTRSLQLNVLLRQYAHTRPNTDVVGADVLQHAKFAEFFFDENTVPVYLWCQSIKHNIESCAWQPTSTSRNWSVTNPVMLSPIGVVTKNLFLLYAQKEWAEIEFLNALLATHLHQPNTGFIGRSSLHTADWLGIGLRLDLTKLYTLAAHEFIARNAPIAAAECMHLSRQTAAQRLEACAKLQPKSAKLFLMHSLSRAVNRDGMLQIAKNEARVLCEAAIVCACTELCMKSESIVNIGSQSTLNELINRWVLSTEQLVAPEIIFNILADFGQVEQLFRVARKTSCFSDALSVLAQLDWKYRMTLDLDNNDMSNIVEMIQLRYFEHILTCLSTKDLEIYDERSIESIISLTRKALIQLDLMQDCTLKWLIGFTDPTKSPGSTFIDIAHENQSRCHSLANFTLTQSPIGSHVAAIELENEFMKLLEKDPHRVLAALWLQLHIETLIVCKQRLPIESNQLQQQQACAGINLEFIQLYFKEAADLSTTLKSKSMSANRLANNFIRGGRDYVVFVQNGLVNFVNGPVPDRAPLTLYRQGHRVVEIACGTRHALIWVQNHNSGTEKLLAIGHNTFGQLGCPDLAMSEFSTVPVDVSMPSHVELRDIACGHFHSLIVCTNGQAFAWGWAVHGQLGCDVIAPQRAPRKVCVSEKIVQSCGGLYHSIFLTEHGQVLACGSNIGGQLAQSDAKIQKSRTPLLIEGIEGKVTLIDCGFFHSICVSECERNSAQQKVWIWGHPIIMLQLGGRRYNEPSWADSWLPQLVDIDEALDKAGGGPIVRLKCGTNHSLLMTKSGKLLSVGKNMYGQLGTKNRLDSMLKAQCVVLADDVSVQDIFCDDGLSIALTIEPLQILRWGRGSHPSIIDQTQLSIGISSEDKAQPCTWKTKITNDYSSYSKEHFSFSCNSWNPEELLPLLRTHVQLLHRQQLVNKLSYRSRVNEQLAASAVLSDLLLIEDKFLPSLVWRKRQLMQSLHLSSENINQEALMQNVLQIVTFYLQCLALQELTRSKNQGTNACINLILHLWLIDLHFPAEKLEAMLLENLDLVYMTLCNSLSKSYHRQQESAEKQGIMDHFSKHFHLKVITFALKTKTASATILNEFDTSAVPLVAGQKILLNVADLERFSNKEKVKPPVKSIYASTADKQQVVFSCAHRVELCAMHETIIPNLIKELRNFNLPISAKVCQLYYQANRALIICPVCLQKSIANE